MMRDVLPRSAAIVLVAALVLAGILGGMSRPARGANTAISGTSPPNGEQNVNLSESILVQFTNPMDTGSVTWSILPQVSAPAGWSASNTLLNLTPDAPLPPCSLYTVEIRGNDSVGDPLVPGPIPNPWSFSTESSRPCIVSTIPADGAADVPPGGGITIDFSALVDLARLPVDAFELTPYAGTYSMVWSFTRLAVLVSLSPCSTYRAGFRDGWGYVPGLVPNPWSFTTVCPQVII